MASGPNNKYMSSRDTDHLGTTKGHILVLSQVFITGDVHGIQLLKGKQEYKHKRKYYKWMQ